MDYSALKDEELIERFKRGEEEAFHVLFQRYKLKVVRVAYRYTKDVQISEDIAHEVFIEIYKNIQRFLGKSRFFSYVYRITFNKAADYVRSKMRAKEFSMDRETESGEPDNASFASGGDSARQAYDKQELNQLLERALGQLTEMERKVFILTQIEELSYDEASQTLGISKGTIGPYIFRAREKLRKLLPLDILQIFLFWRSYFSEKIIWPMSLMFENAKLLIGRPSLMLVSYYVDGETDKWQSKRLEMLFQSRPALQEARLDYQKIHALFNRLKTPALNPNFDYVFQERLSNALLETEPSRAWAFEWPKPLVPALAALFLAAGIFFTHHLLKGSEAFVSNVRGTVESYSIKTRTWDSLRPDSRIQRGQRIRTKNGSADFELKDQWRVLVKENSEVTFDKLFRSRQKGEIFISQISGKTLTSIGAKFKGSRLSIETPFGFAHAFGTKFLVEVLPEQEAARLMVLEGTVEAQDKGRRFLVPVTPQTQTYLYQTHVGEAFPLTPDQEAEAKELQMLKSGEEANPPGTLDETISLMMIAGPKRVEEYLKNPRIFARRNYPFLTEKINQTRQLVLKASQENKPELYGQVVQDLDGFTRNYLDPYGYFRPHLYFHNGAFYHFFLHQEENALESFGRLTADPNPSWRAMAYLARGIIYQEFLHDLLKARQEYLKVSEAVPDSPEAAEAKRRLALLTD